MYWPIGITGVSSILHVPHTSAQGPPVPLGLFIRNIDGFSRIISPSVSFLESTISCDVRDWTAMDCEWKPWVVSFTFSSTFTSSSTWKCLDELQVGLDIYDTPVDFCWCFQGESVSTQSRNAHLDLQLVASLNWILTVKLSLGARYEARDVQYNSNLAYVFTTREEFWSQSVGFKSERMQLIWVSFTSEYLQVNVVHLSANVSFTTAPVLLLTVGVAIQSLQTVVFVQNVLLLSDAGERE